MTKPVEHINALILDGRYAEAIDYISAVRDSLTPSVCERYLNYCRFKAGKCVDLAPSFRLGESRDCVCLNTTVSEISKIEKLFKIWSIFHGNDQGQGKYFPHLVVAFDVYQEESVAQTRNLIRKYRVDEIFCSIRIINVAVPSDYNFYRRVADGSLDLKKCKYGYKSGPNYQFFALMKVLSRDGYNHVYLCETDTFPLQRAWASRLFEESHKQTPFWVLGSPFLGRSKLDPSIALHINGSAIYAVGDPGFRAHLTNWEEILLQLVPQVPYIAYDWALDYYFYKRLSAANWDNLGYQDFHAQIQFKKMCRYTDLILNFAGEAERAGEGHYSIAEICSVYEQAAIVHGDYFYAELIRGYESSANEPLAATELN